MKQFATIHQHTNASRNFIKTESLLEISNKSRTEEMTYCLLYYNPLIFYLSIITFINMNQLKIQFVCHATSMNKTLITSFENVQQLTP